MLLLAKLVSPKAVHHVSNGCGDYAGGIAPRAATAAGRYFACMAVGMASDALAHRPGAWRPPPPVSPASERTVNAPQTLPADTRAQLS